MSPSMPGTKRCHTGVNPLSPFLFQRGKKHSTISPFSHPRWAPRSALLQTHSWKQNKKANFQSSLSRPSVTCVSPHAEPTCSKEATPSTASAPPHPAQQQVPGSLRSALGRVSQELSGSECWPFILLNREQWSQTAWEGQCQAGKGSERQGSTQRKEMNLPLILTPRTLKELENFNVQYTCHQAKATYEPNTENWPFPVFLCGHHLHNRMGSRVGRERTMANPVVIDDWVCNCSQTGSLGRHINALIHTLILTTLSLSHSIRASHLALA